MAHGFVGTPAQVLALRGECLLRDRHRYVVWRKFDVHEATNRFNRDDDNARDDDVNLLEGEPLDSLEVAHILPHSLTKVNANHKLVSFVSLQLPPHMANLSLGQCWRSCARSP